MSVPGLACGGLFIGGDDAQITVTGSNTVTDTANANTYTFNNVSGLNSHTHVFLTVTIRGSAGGVTVSSLTVEGNAATFVVGLTTGFQRSEIWKITSGVVTPDIVANLSGTAANIKVGVVATNGADLTNFATPTSSNADPAALSIATAAKGLVIAAGLNASSGTMAWTGVTEQSDSNLETSYTHTWGYSTTTTAESPRTVSGDWSGTNNNTTVCASFGPAATTINPPRILDGYSNVTGAWSMSRQLLSSFASARYTTETGVGSIIDQTGNARHLSNTTDVAQPTVVSAGPKARLAASFDGSNDWLGSPDFQSLVTFSAGYVAACALIRAVTTNNLSNPTFNDSVWYGWAGAILLRNNSGVQSWISFNDIGTGSENGSTVGATENYIDTVCVFEWRHEGGVLYGRMTQAGGSPGAWQSVSSGDTYDIGNLRIGWNGSAIFTQEDFFELVSFNAVPNGGQRDALVANMLAHYG